MPLTDELLTELLVTAQEQLRWQRAAVLPQIRATVEAALATAQLRQAYELCDGTRTSADVGKAVGASPATMSRWTRRWSDLGIAYEDDRRIKHLASLSALGLSIEVEPSQ